MTIQSDSPFLKTVFIVGYQENGWKGIMSFDVVVCGNENIGLVLKSDPTYIIHISSLGF